MSDTQEHTSSKTKSIDCFISKDNAPERLPGSEFASKNTEDPSPAFQVAKPAR